MHAVNLDNMTKYFDGPDKYQAFIKDLRRILADHPFATIVNGATVLGHIISPERLTELAREEVRRHQTS